MIHQTYSLCEINIQVQARDVDLATRLDQLWRVALQVHPQQTPISKASIQFTLCAIGTPPVRSDKAVEVHRQSRLCIWRTPTGFYLQCGEAYLALDTGRNLAVGLIPAAFWRYYLSEQREFFLFALLFFLCVRGFYALHANSVVKDDLNILIAGPSGRGKTTLTLSLLQAGWCCGGDDVLVLQRIDAGVIAHAMRRGLSCTDETAALFPAVAALDPEAPSDGDKRLLRLEQSCPGLFITSNQPRLLLAPQIVETPHTALVPMQPTASLLSLLDMTIFTFYQATVAALHLDVFKQLIEQVRCYRILLGRDVLETPATVGTLLEQAAS